MADRLVDPARTDRAKIATSTVGSTSARMVVSRLAPIPPNAVPVSSPASASTTRAVREQRHHHEQVGHRVVAALGAPHPGLLLGAADEQHPLLLGDFVAARGLELVSFGKGQCKDDIAKEFLTGATGEG